MILMIGDMTDKERLRLYRMTVLLPAPEGIYKNDQSLTDEQREKFMSITDFEEAHAYYTYWSANNYTDEFRSILKEMNE